MKIKLFYHQRLLIVYLVFVWFTAGCFTLYQYRHERQYKINLLDERLQWLNTRLLSDRRAGKSPAAFYENYRRMIHDMRLTLIKSSGSVVYDSEKSTNIRHENHLSRPEVREALEKGSGYAIRHSETTGLSYFYSAKADGELISRIAVPYNMSLITFLRPNNTFLWLLLLITVVFSVLGCVMTRRLSENIRRLQRFAQMAGSGEPINMNTDFPHDELGEISTQIVKLYNRLLRTMDDRDRERQAAIEEANDKIRLKRQLTSNINHELKTPLAAIKGYLETILTYPDMKAEQRDLFIQKSYEQTGRLSELLRDVSTISKLEETGSSLRQEEVDLSGIIKELREYLGLLPQDNPWTLNTNIETPLLVKGDNALLRSVFENLLSNSVAHSGGNSVWIELLNEQDGFCHLRFSDNGSGVPQDKLRFLFDRFYRVDGGRSRKTGGTGLGLSIVKNAIINLGGQISVRNGAHGGLEFNFTLLKA